MENRRKRGKENDDVVFVSTGEIKGKTEKKATTKKLTTITATTSTVALPLLLLPLPSNPQIIAWSKNCKRATTDTTDTIFRLDGGCAQHGLE